MRARSPDSDFSLSKETVLWLRKELQEFFDDDNQLSKCIEALDSAKRSFDSLEGYADGKQIRELYIRTAQEIATLQDSLDEFGSTEIETLSDLIEGFEDDKTLALFDSCVSDPSIRGLYGVTCFQTREQLSILRRALEHAISQIIVPRGARPNTDYRDLAWCIAEELKDSLGVELTTYDDGLYFRALSVMFEDSFGDVGSEAHRRHGTWCLREDDADMDDVALKHLPNGRVGTE